MAAVNLTDSERDVIVALAEEHYAKLRSVRAEHLNTSQQSNARLAALAELLFKLRASP